MIVVFGWSVEDSGERTRRWLTPRARSVLYSASVSLTVLGILAPTTPMSLSAMTIGWVVGMGLSLRYIFRPSQMGWNPPEPVKDPYLWHQGGGEMIWIDPRDEPGF